MIVLWRVTQRCNLSCPFCAYDRRVEWQRNEAEPALVRRFGDVLSAYQRQTGDRVLVSWLGGEPLLWPPLKKLTVAFTQLLGLRVSATTNGTTLGSPAQREHLLEHYAELTISVDGVGATHDRLRGWPGGFAELRDGIQALAEARRTTGRGPKLRVNTVLMRTNLDEFEPLCLELASWGVEEITFNQLGGRDRPEFHPAHRLLPAQAEQLAGLLPALRERLAASGVRLVGSPEYLRRIAASARDERIPIADCHPGERFLFITERGVASPCSFTVDGYGVPLEEMDSAEALAGLSARFSEARRRQRLAPCEDCHSTQVFEKFTA
jgi:MoaA/NifB/PqqE/SkfB family radical SAM enzyme